MATRRTFNTFLQRRNSKKSCNDGTDPFQSHCKESGFNNQSGILDIEKAARAERAALIQRVNKRYASQQAHNNAVLERLGFSTQQGSLPSPQPPASPRQGPETSLQRRGIRPISHVPPLNLEEKNCCQMPGTNHMMDKEDPFFEKKLRLGSQMAILASKLSKLKARDKSPSLDSLDSSDGSMDTIRSTDTHTPSELRAISLLQSPILSPFTPTPPQKAPSRKKSPSRLPVKIIRAGKEVAGERGLQSAKSKVNGIVEKVEKLQLVGLPSSPPPAPPRRTNFVPTPPSVAAPTNRRGTRRGTNLRLPEANNGGVKDDIPPLANSANILSICFGQLQSDDWEKKMDGFKSVQALARHHPDLLQTKLHEVCLILTEEVKNLRSVVACAAMDTIAMLHVHLGKAMDPEAERTGRALLLKLAETTSTFIHQKVNLALDTLVEGCSPGRAASALLKTGLSHRCGAVRGSTAMHLHQLADIIGEEQILTAGKIFTERFIIAVCKMSVDAAPEVRHHGQKMLQGLVCQRDFMMLWNKVIPEKDKPPLLKIMKKMRQ